MTQSRPFTFGLEVEMIVNRESAAAIVGSLTNQQVERIDDETYKIGEWQICRDDSILAAGEKQTELVSGVFRNTGELSYLERLLDALKKIGATVNESCGAHVHIGGLTAEAVVTLARMLEHLEPSIYKAFDVFQSRLRFATPVSKDFLLRLDVGTGAGVPVGPANCLREAWYGRAPGNLDRYDDSRYAALNIHSWFYRGTVEFRYFNSTLDGSVLRRYIQTSLALADLARCLTEPPSDYSAEASDLRRDL